MNCLVLAALHSFLSTPSSRFSPSAAPARLPPRRRCFFSLPAQRQQRAGAAAPVDNASSSGESVAHLKALYFLRPSSDNVQKLRWHLAAPRFAEYRLFFSNILKIPHIQVLADSVEQEVVQQVQEFYGDFCAIDPYHFTLNIHNNHIYMLPTVVDPPGMQSFCDRAVDGIASVFLALKRADCIHIGSMKIPLFPVVVISVKN